MKYFNIITQEERVIDSDTQLYLVCVDNKYFVRAAQKEELEQYNAEPTGRHDKYWKLPFPNKNLIKLFDGELLITERSYTSQEILDIFEILPLSLNQHFFKKKPDYPMSIVILARRVGISENMMYEIYNQENQNVYMNLVVCAAFIENNLMTVFEAIELTPKERIKLARTQSLLLARPPQLTIPEALAMDDAQTLSLFTPTRIAAPVPDNNIVETSCCAKCTIF